MSTSDGEHGVCGALSFGITAESVEWVLAWWGEQRGEFT